MSYGLFSKPGCFLCARWEKCVDFTVLSGALNAIHSLKKQKGHLGSGSITLECARFEEKPKV